MANEEVGVAVEAAIDHGYRHIDCAWVYGNEKAVGTAVNNKIKCNQVKREQLFITSKLWNNRHEPQYVREAFMESLQRLQLDYLDLYLMHFPIGYKKEKEDGKNVYSDADYLTTWKEMEKLVSEGLVKSIGVSNFNQFQLNRIIEEGSVVPAVNQIEVHPYLSNNQLVEFCHSKNVLVTAYSPFASPDRSWAPEGEEHVLDDPFINQISKRLGKSPAQIILRYLLQRGLVVIPKSKTPSRIKENFQVRDFKLSEEDMKVIEQLNRNYRALGLNDSPHKYYPWKEDYKE